MEAAGCVGGDVVGKDLGLDGEDGVFLEVSVQLC